MADYSLVDATRVALLPAWVDTSQSCCSPCCLRDGCHGVESRTCVELDWLEKSKLKSNVRVIEFRKEAATLDWNNSRDDAPRARSFLTYAVQIKC
jgi:hypothetical protein